MQEIVMDENWSCQRCAVATLEQRGGKNIEGAIRDK